MKVPRTLPLELLAPLGCGLQTGAGTVMNSLLNPGGKAALLSGARGPGQLPGGREVLSVIQGDAVPQKFIPKLIRLFRGGRFPFDRLVRFYDFAQTNRAIADSRHGRTVKPVLLMPAQASLRTLRRVTKHSRERRSDDE